MNAITLGEYSALQDYLIDNNKRLIDNGDTPIAVCLEGEAGIGKTSVVRQLAEAKGMTYVQINLAQIEEPAELVGFPVKEYLVKVDGEEKWIAADLLKNLDCNIEITNESRMGYAVPKWLPREFNPNGTMLVLDDFSRANGLIMQAIMEIINTGSYISWNLPKYTNIVLTSNPDNGDFQVSSLDAAQASRMITFCGKFDIGEWARWAEGFGIDGRAINFALLYSSEIFEPKNNVTLANARNYTTFCRAISGLNDWSTVESLSMIMQMAHGCFLHKENNTMGSLFTQFVNNKLDKLIPPEKLLDDNWDTVRTEIEHCVYDHDQFRADIANVLATRFLNYCDQNMGTPKAPAAKVGARLAEFMEAGKEKELFSQDILYNVEKTLCKAHPAQTNRWFTNKTLRDIAL